MQLARPAEGGRASYPLAETMEVREIGRNDFANVRLRCPRCGHQMTFCVHIDRGGVPQELRCSPAPGGGGGPEIRCAGCRAPCFRTIDDLRRAVDAALRRGWGPHIRAGAVEIECSE